LQKKRSTLLSATLFYCFFVLFHGYIYGEGDQVEILSYAKYLLNNTLYSNDLYIQSIAQSVPNERIFLSYLLHCFGNTYMEWGVLGLHALSGIALFAAWIRLEGNTPWAVWFLLLLFVPFYYFNLGGNDLYYGIFAGSCTAKALGSWAIVFFLEHKRTIAYGLLAIATFFQPMVGAQLFLIFTIILILKERMAATRRRSLAVISPLLFLSTAGIWLALLLFKQQTKVLSADSYLDINEFRASHHFFPAYFKLKNWLIFVPTFALGLYLYWFDFKKNKMEKKDENNIHFTLKLPSFGGAGGGFFFISFFFISILGLIAYTIGVQYFRLPLFLSTQWFKVTIWLKGFAVLILFKKSIQLAGSVEGNLRSQLPTANLLIFFLAVLLFFVPQLRNMPQQFPWTSYKNAPSIDIALQAKEKTSPNALFVQAADITWFKYWSERSSYIDYKPILQTQQYLATWYDRIRAVYHIDLSDRRAGKDLVMTANTHFFALREVDFLALKKQGVSHILTLKNHALDFPIVVENEVYRVYEIISP
jgi:MFS family permease